MAYVDSVTTTPYNFQPFIGQDGGQTYSQSANALNGTPLGSDGSVYAGLIDKLRGFLQDNQELFQSAGAGSTFEISVQANIKRTFEASVTQSGANGAAASAYMSASEEMNFSATFRVQQAQNLASAHADAASSDQFGPEATAGRITDFALSFFPMFAKQHSDMSHEDQVDAYKNLVEGAIDKGFKEALAILGSMPKSVTDSINQTRDLIQQKLESFFSALKGDGAEEGKKAANDGSWSQYVQDFFNTSQRARQRASISDAS